MTRAQEDVTFTFPRYSQCHFDVNLAWTTHVGSSIISTPRIVHSARDGGKDILLSTFANYVEALSGTTGEDVMGFPFTQPQLRSYASLVAVPTGEETNRAHHHDTTDWLLAQYNGELLVLGADGDARGVIRVPPLSVRRDWAQAAEENTSLQDLAFVSLAQPPPREDWWQWAALRRAHRVRRLYAPMTASPTYSEYDEQGNENAYAYEYRAYEQDMQKWAHATESTTYARDTNGRNAENADENEEEKKHVQDLQRDMGVAGQKKNDDKQGRSETNATRVAHVTREEEERHEEEFRYKPEADAEDARQPLARSKTVQDVLNVLNPSTTLRNNNNNNNNNNNSNQSKQQLMAEYEDWLNWDLKDTEILDMNEGNDDAAWEDARGPQSQRTHPTGSPLSPEARAGWSLLWDSDTGGARGNHSLLRRRYVEEAAVWHNTSASLRPPIRIRHHARETMLLSPHLLSTPVVADVNEDGELDVVMHVSYFSDDDTSEPHAPTATAVVCINFVTGQLNWVHVLYLGERTAHNNSNNHTNSSSDHSSTNNNNNTNNNYDNMMNDNSDGNTEENKVLRSPTLHRFRTDTFGWFTIIYVTTSWGEVVVLSGHNGQLWDGAVHAVVPPMSSVYDTSSPWTRSRGDVHDTNLPPSQTTRTVTRRTGEAQDMRNELSHRGTAEADTLHTWPSAPKQSRTPAPSPACHHSRRVHGRVGKTTRNCAAAHTLNEWPRQTGYTKGSDPNTAALYAGVTVAAVQEPHTVSVCLGDALGRVRCYTAHGRLLWEQLLVGAVVSSVSVGDVNGDGEMEVCVGTLAGYVYALRGRDGAVLPHFPIRTEGAIVAPIALTQIRPTHVPTDTQRQQKYRNNKHNNDNHTNTTTTTNKDDNNNNKENKVFNDGSSATYHSDGLQLIVPSHDGRVYLIDGRTGCVDTLDLDETSSTMILADDLTGHGRVQLLVTTLSGGVYVFHSHARHHPRRRWDMAGYRLSMSQEEVLGAGGGAVGVWIAAAHRHWRDVVGDRMTLRICVVDDARSATLPRFGGTTTTTTATQTGTAHTGISIEPEYVVTIWVGGQDEVYRALYRAPGTYAVTMPTPRDRRHYAVVTVTMTLSTTGQVYSDSITLSFNMHYLETIKFTLVAPFALFCVALMLVHKKHEHPDPVHDYVMML